MALPDPPAGVPTTHITRSTDNMVILDEPASYNYELRTWYCSHLFWRGEHWMDLLRIKLILRPFATNIMHGRNSYTYYPVDNYPPIPHEEPIYAMLYLPPPLRVVKRGSAWWVLGGYDPTARAHGPYTAKTDRAARAEAEEAMAGMLRYYAQPDTRAWYKKDAIDKETLAEDAELWCETVVGRPCPPYGTPAWDKMYANFINNMFAPAGEYRE